MSLGIVYRLDKGSPLTFKETDNNFRKLENAFDRLTSLLAGPDVASAIAFTDTKTDFVNYFDTGSDSYRKMVVARFIEQIMTQIPEITAIADDDRALILDASAVDGLQTVTVSIKDILPDITAAKTVAYPKSVTVDTKGRVTAMEGGSSLFTETTEFEFPVRGEYKTVPNPLGTKLKFIRVVAVCKVATRDGYAEGDEYEIAGIGADINEGDVDTPAYGVSSNALTITLSSFTSTHIQRYVNKTGGTADWSAAVEALAWKWKAYVI